MRHWFTLIKYCEIVKLFNIETEISEKIQKDFIENKSILTADDLDRMLNLTKLYSLSKGVLNMTFEDYTYIKLCEKERKERLILK